MVPVCKMFRLKGFGEAGVYVYGQWTFAGERDGGMEDKEFRFILRPRLSEGIAGCSAAR